MSRRKNSDSSAASRQTKRGFVPRGSRGRQYALLAFCASLLASLLANSNWRAVQFLNAFGIDTCFVWRGGHAPQEVSEKLPQSRNIVIVELPHEVPRWLLARLIDKLKMAKVVGIDLMFSDREKELLDRERPLYQGELARWRRENALLAESIKAANNVVIGTWPDRIYVQDKLGRMQTKVVWTPAASSIEKAARWKAHLNVIPDVQDGLIRRVLLWQGGDKVGVPALDEKNTHLLPAFGLCLAAAMKGKTPQEVAREATLVGPQEMIIDYLGTRECFQTDTNRILYNEVLKYPAETFAGQIILIGETSYTTKDTFPTPFGDMPGLFIHANITATLLSERGAPRHVPFALVVAVSFVASFILLIPLLLRKPMWVCLPLALVEILVAIGLVVYIWLYSHAVLPLSAPLVALFLTYNAVALYEYVRARRVLGRVVGSEGTEQLLDALVEPELGGKEEVATAFFCDLRGYTTLSQHLPPQTLIALLNLYTDALVKEVLRFGGRPIDYFGDGVFVLFEGPQHAARGLRAALYSHEAVRTRFMEVQALAETRPELRDAPKKSPEMGIALHTGPMIIGLVGSLQRPKPGAVGDAVNVASRVQGLSDVCNMSVLLTRATLEALGDWDESEARIQPCGKHPVKGRDELVEVFGAELVISQTAE